jgi:hypothetical protein
MRRITIKWGVENNWQTFDVPSGQTIEEVAAQFIPITPGIQQAINEQFGTPQERAAEAFEADIVAQINAHLLALNTPIVLPGTAALALPAIQTFINDTITREKQMLRLLRKIVKDNY